MCAGQGGVAESSPECAPAWKRLLCIWGVGSAGAGAAGPLQPPCPPAPGHPTPSLPWRTSPLNTNTYDFPPTQPLTKEERARRARSRCFLGQKAANPALSHRRGLRTT